MSISYEDHFLFSQSEWEVVLRLASLWGFDVLKSKAVSELDELITDPVDRYELGKAHGITDWVDSSIIALALRRESVTPAEAARIGYDVAYKLQLCREGGARNKEDVSLAFRMKTAISNTFGLDGTFVDKVAEYQALPEEMKKVPVR